MTPTSRHQHKGGEQGDLILRQVHRTQVFPKLEDGADQVVTACHSKGHREEGRWMILVRLLLPINYVAHEIILLNI